MDTRFFGKYKDTSAESISGVMDFLNKTPLRQGSNQMVGEKREEVAPVQVMKREHWGKVTEKCDCSDETIKGAMAFLDKKPMRQGSNQTLKKNESN